ncbi:MAG: translocation/assembly module TamB domain-containing protein [Pseudomonadota bacterium]
MKRRPILLVISVALAVVVIPALLVLGTPFGLRWALKALEPQLPVRLENVTGTLLSEVRAARVSYADEQVEVTLAELAVSPRLACLWRGRICLRGVHVKTMDVATGPGGGSSSGDPLAAFEALPSISVAELRVGVLNLAADDTSEAIRDLHLAGRLDPSGLALEEVALCHDLGCVDGALTLGARGRWTLSSNLDGGSALPDLSEFQIPRRLVLEASGSLDGAEFVLNDRDGAGVNLSGTLSRSEAGVEARLALAGLASLLPTLREADWLAVSGPLDLQFSGSAESWNLGFAQAISIEQAVTQPVRGELRREAEGWYLERLSLGDEELPALSLSAAWPDPRSPVIIEAQAASFSVPKVSGLPDGVLEGNVNLRLSPGEERTAWALHTPGLSLGEGGRLWRAKGELSGADRVDLPFGDLSVALRPPEVPRDQEIAFRYTRDEASKRAVLASAGPLTLGELEMTSLELERLADDGQRFRLRGIGDVTTLIDFALERDASSVQVRIDPFSVEYAGQALSSDETVQLSWEAQRETLSLGPLCLRWQGSRLCSSATDLAASGDLQLVIELSEEYADRIADKPFAVSASGAGNLTLRWKDWNPEQGSVELVLDALRVDPFVGDETAEAVVFERVAVAGQLDDAGATLELHLASEQVGDVDVDMSLEQGRLNGALVAEALSLAALTDVLPRWSIQARTLSADLQIAGTSEEPQLAGKVQVRDAALTIPELDTRIDALNVATIFEGRNFDIEGSATLGGGELRLDGRCCEDRQLLAKLTGDRNRLTLPNGLDAVLTPTLDLAFDPRRLGVRGSVAVHEGVFVHSGLGEDGVDVSSDVVRVDRSAAQAQRFALDLELRTLIEPGFTLRSQQLESTLGGDVRLRMRSGLPISLFGNLDVLGGELRVYGQALRLTDGSLGFVGDAENPDLNISAEREIRSENQRVGFRVTGTLEAPRFDLFSDPRRPDYVTLSYLLRGRGPDVGASADGTAMALSLGASALNQSGVLAPLNSLPGLSGVTIGAEGTDEDMSATISAYVGNRLYLSYGLGIYEPINALTARLYLRSRLWLEVVSRLESSFDLYYRFDTD